MLPSGRRGRRFKSGHPDRETAGHKASSGLPFTLRVPGCPILGARWERTQVTVGPLGPRLAPSLWPLPGAATTYSTASRARLRRAGPDGLRGFEGRRDPPRGRERPGDMAMSGLGRRVPRPSRGGSFRHALRAEDLRRGDCRARLPRHRARVRSPPYIQGAAPANAVCPSPLCPASCRRT